MQYADYYFYKNEYHGIIIDKEDDYAYFSEMAGDELAIYANRVPNTTEAQTLLKRCACRITDILFGDYRSSKNGAKITSESVSGYYTVSYSVSDSATVRRAINTAITLYLGRYVLSKTKRVII